MWGLLGAGGKERHGEGVGGRRWIAAVLDTVVREGLTEKVKCPRNIVNNGKCNLKPNNSQIHQIVKPCEPKFNTPARG